MRILLCSSIRDNDSPDIFAHVERCRHPRAPSPLHFADGSQNEISDQHLSATETVIQFFAPNPGCGNTKPWVAVWPSDASEPYLADYKVWQYVEPTSGLKPHTVKFNNTELGIGEYKAAFVCEDGRRSPWMVSETFKVGPVPCEYEGWCAHRAGQYNNAWMYTACDKVAHELCEGCQLGLKCVACRDCIAQCGLSDDIDIGFGDLSR
ncbi:hypothetical protein BBAD15_g5395 [Beauveria bassiana D1-5]|uniref:Uncharacterized protein n=1 Tax=Beauveria bassiana D1-5 TaxID=1245745 RepID=A0A0A2VSZ8_BEABA|nr:hypothetical protein BBAD15_g5395 [Beauveria bassiana D1-5]